MPFSSRATIVVANDGIVDRKMSLAICHKPLERDARDLLRFHAKWHRDALLEKPKREGRDIDWTLLIAEGGPGRFCGVNMHVWNRWAEPQQPSRDWWYGTGGSKSVDWWWGEGDEKIFVDGETFPSHFGTGTEDYYGYGWCDSRIFNTPFVSQVRCDGNGRSNRGYSCVTRVRALDAIPFNSGLDMNIEVWHWIKCEVAYATTAYFYAKPGFTTNRTPDEAGAKAPVPQPPPLPPVFTIPGAIECESLAISEKSGSLSSAEQPLDRFGVSRWSNNAHLWCRGTTVGEFIELKIPAPAGKHAVVLHATRSWDYATVQFALNGTEVGKPVDFYSGGEMVIGPTGPIELGVAESKDGFILLRATLAGKNAAAQRPGTYFGLDAVVLTPAK